MSVGINLIDMVFLFGIKQTSLKKAQIIKLTRCRDDNIMVTN
jgi:hypothetical protein